MLLKSLVNLIGEKMTKLMRLKNGQFILTIPKNIVFAKGMKKGTEVKFLIDKGGDIVLKVD